MLNVKNWKIVNQKEGNKSHYNNPQTQRDSFGIYPPILSLSLFLPKFSRYYLTKGPVTRMQ